MKRLFPMLVLFLFLPFVAFAQAVPPAASHPLITQDNVLAVLGALVTFAVWAYRTFSKQTAEQKATRLALIQNFVHYAYLGVSEIARRTPNLVDDKAALGLEKVDEMLKAAGEPPLSTDEQKKVQIMFDAKHFDEKQAAAVPR